MENASASAEPVPFELMQCPVCGLNSRMLFDLHRPRAGEPRRRYYCDNCLAAGFIHATPNDKPLAAELWDLYLSLNRTFCAGVADAALLARWGIPADPQSPLRRCFYNHFMGYSLSSPLQSFLRKLLGKSVEGMGSWSPAHSRPCLLIPQQIVPGYITSFVILGEAAPSVVAIRRVRGLSRMYLTTHPSSKSIFYPSFADALLHGPTEALRGFKGMMSCPTLLTERTLSRRGAEQP